MKLGGRTRLSLGLILGLISGLVLVILPGILAPSSQTATFSGGNTRTIPSSFTAGPGFSNSQPATQPYATISSTIILLVLVVLPAISLGFLARYQTLKHAKDELNPMHK